MTTDWNNKSNKNKWNVNTRRREDRPCQDGCQWTPLFCPCPIQRGNPAVFVFFSLHQVNFVVDMLNRQQCKAARASDWQSSIAPEYPSTKSAFSLPKEYMCMFKAHSLSLERVVFSFLGSWFVWPCQLSVVSHHHLCIKTGPSNKSQYEYCTSQCTVELKKKRETWHCAKLWHLVGQS